MATWFYFIMFGFFLTHELDAMKRHEWRVLPLTSWLPDRVGEQVFLWAHVPLTAGLLGFGGWDPRSGVAIALSAFAVVHVGLHWVFRNHPDYEFNTVSSWLLIVGAGLFGALHLAVSLL